jgi:hypothetical protein
MTRPGFEHPGCRGGKTATNRLSYGAASLEQILQNDNLICGILGVDSRHRPERQDLWSTLFGWTRHLIKMRCCVTYDCVYSYWDPCNHQYIVYKSDRNFDWYGYMSTLGYRRT